jgi:hypothetical protein
MGNEEKGKIDCGKVEIRRRLHKISHHNRLPLQTHRFCFDDDYNREARLRSIKKWVLLTSSWYNVDLSMVYMACNREKQQ